VICVVPSTENMPGGKAQKPGDIQTAMSGKTIEVLIRRRRPTHPRRCIHYAKQLGATHLVDAATLTAPSSLPSPTSTSASSARIKLLPTSSSPARKPLAKNVANAIGRRLPRFHQGNRRRYPNISSGKGGGAITGAMFIKEFTGDTPGFT